MVYSLHGQCTTLLAKVRHFFGIQWAQRLLISIPKHLIQIVSSFRDGCCHWALSESPEGAMLPILIVRDRSSLCLTIKPSWTSFRTEQSCILKTGCISSLSYSSWYCPFRSFELMDPTYPLVPVVNFLSCILVCLPLFSTALYSGSWNISLAVFTIWTAVECITSGVNAIIWSDNVDNVAPIWCDISELIGSSAYTSKGYLEGLLVIQQLTLTLRLWSQCVLVRSL